MIYVVLPEDKQYSLPFYLATEEYIAREFPAQEYFFMWQVEPTVIFGRNQFIGSEVDTEYCKSQGIQFYRRKSGGGCVYADRSNIMLSYISPSTNVNFTFNSYMLMIEHALQKLGVDARTSGRNDILVDNKKISGNAFYHLPHRSIVHGTMLYDTDLEHMTKATTPSEAKLKSKGVESVRQHVTTLNNYISISLDELKQHIRSELCTDSIKLSAKDIDKIKEIEQGYYEPSFIYGNNPAYTILRKRRIEGVGEFRTSIEVKNGTIRKIDLAGDFFLVGDVDTMLLDKLCNIPYDRDSIGNSIGDTDCRAVIMNLTKEQLINLLID